MKKLTNEEFIKRLEEKAPTLEPLEEYIKSDVSIDFRCKVCGTIFHNSPIRILGTRNQGCPICHYNSTRIKDDEFKERAKANKNVDVIGEYINSKTKIKVQCVYCKKYFYTRPDSILQGRGHGSCILKNLERKPLKSQEEFIKQLNMVNDKIIPLDTYIKGRNKMNFKCLICGKTWSTRVDHILFDKSGCPYCKKSKGEQRVEQYLIEHNINYDKQHRFSDCKDKRGLPFDFYLPDYNSCIEFDGEQHERPAYGEKSFLQTILHDAMKNNYCKWNNINLIRISHTDFDNIEIILDNFIK